MKGRLWRLTALAGLTALLWLAPWSAGYPCSQPSALAGAACDTETIAATVSGDPAVTITSATAVSVPSTSTEYCEVLGAIATSSGGETGSVEFELGLPISTWNGNFIFIGGGGFVGSLGSVQKAVAAGFAAAVTDAGHESPYGALDGSFGLLLDGSPNLPGREDFSYRAVHLSTTTAKTITQAFYGGSLMQSFFDGCSTGGRQALVEAQLFPTDYNGIIAGDPAIGDPIAGFNWNDQALFATPDSYLPPDKIQLLDQAVLTKCDRVDGTADGLIQDPRQCKFDPATLECAGGDAPTCLTADQVATIKKIYSGARTPNGQQLYPGYMPSDPGGADGWTAWISSDSSPTPPEGLPEPWGPPPESFATAPYQWTFQDQFMKFFVFDDPSYDSLSFNFADRSQVSQLSSIVSEFGGNGVDTDLSRFFGNGGKLIMYHGWSDPALSPLVSVDYYEGVAKTMGGGFAHLRDNARLFMVPGMHHCAGGPGPNTFDALTPLIQWVEAGNAPDQIVAYHFKNNDPIDNLVPDRSMPLCPYPQVAVFQGGNVDVASNWKCGQHTNHRFSPGHHGGKK